MATTAVKAISSGGRSQDEGGGAGEIKIKD